MKSLLIRLVGFGAFTAAVWGLIFIVCSQWYKLEYTLIGQETNWGYVNQRTAEWADKQVADDDVLFFGSSTCYSSIDPFALEAFGFSGFNFCSSAQNIGNSHHLVQAVLNDAHPIAVILDVYPAIWGRESPSLESTKDWIINSNLRSAAWSKSYRWMAIELLDPMTIVSSFYYDFARSIRRSGTNPSLASDDFGIYQGKGWVERTFPPLDSISCETEFVAMSDYECDIIRSIHQKCEAKSIQLILLNPPQLCEEEFHIPMCFENIIYIEGNDWPGAKKASNYYDDHHLVGDGARDYSAWLASKIAEHARP